MPEPSYDNYFELFRLPLRYAIDPESLSERYRELQRVAHPDRHAHASDQERRIAQQRATYINDAYQTLRDDLRRAQYLLKLSGGVAEERTVSDPRFLMEQMGLRETLETARAQRDLAVLDQLFEEIRRLEQGCRIELEEAFSAGTGGLERAAAAITRMQFVRKLAAEAQALEEQLL